MNKHLSILIIIFLSCACKTFQQESGEVQGIYDESKVWTNLPISVCFVTPKDQAVPFEQFAKYGEKKTMKKHSEEYAYAQFLAGKIIEKNRELIKLLLASTWAAEGGVTFTGWDDCTEQTARLGISISLVDQQLADAKFYTMEFAAILLEKEKSAGSSTIGIDALTKYPSMQITVDRNEGDFYKNTIIHEFGHALGIKHEHERPDSNCHKGIGPQPATGKILVGEFDKDSVMSYCASTKLTKLSDGDIATIQKMYGIVK